MFGLFKRARRRRDNWRAAAEERGGSVSWWKGHSAPVGEALARFGYVQSDNSSHSYFKAFYVGRIGPVFKLYKEGFFSKAVESIALATDAKTGDTSFDQRFAIRCEYPEILSTLFPPPIRQELLTMKHVSVKSNGRSVQILNQRILTERSDIEKHLRLLEHFCNCDFWGLSALKQIENGQYVPAQGPWRKRSLPCAIVQAPQAVTVGPAITDDTLFTDVRMALDGERNTFPEGQLTKEQILHFPNSAHILGGKLLGAHYWSRKKAHGIRWDGIQWDHELLETAARFLNVVATADGGPFR